MADNTVPRLSSNDAESIYFQPNISFIQPESIPGPQAPVVEEQKLEDTRDRVNALINGYTQLDKLAALAQVKIDARSGGLIIHLDKNKDQHVVQAMRRIYPNKPPLQIDYPSYRKALDCLALNARKQGKKFTISAEERMKAKQNKDLFTTTKIGGFGTLPGLNRPELQNQVMPELDMEEYQKNLVIILFEQMLPMIINVIMSLLDPFFSGGDNGPGELPEGQLYTPPTGLAEAGEKVKSKVADLLKQNQAERATSPFALPDNSLAEAFADKDINAVQLADCATVAKAYERGSLYTFTEPAVFAPISRIVQNNRVFAAQAVDTLSFTTLQLPDIQEQAEQRALTDKDGNIHQDKRNTVGTVFGTVVPETTSLASQETSTVEDTVDWNLRKSIESDGAELDFIDFLTDLKERQTDGPGNPDVAPIEVAGAQFKNTFLAKSPEDLAKNLLADCIPCIDRIMDLLELQPGEGIIAMLEADLQGRLSGITSIANLLGDTSMYQDICSLFQFLNFMCIPDLQMILATLIAFIMSFIGSLQIVADIGGLISAVLDPLLSPIFSGLSALLEQLLTVITAPITCILDAINAQMQKLNTIDDVVKAAAKGLGSEADLRSIDPIQQGQDKLNQAKSAVSSVPGTVRNAVNDARDTIASTTPFVAIGELFKALQAGQAAIKAEAEKWIQEFQQWLNDVGLAEAAFLNGSFQLLGLSRLIQLVTIMIDFANAKPVCADPKSGILGEFDRFIQDNLQASDWQITLDRSNDSFHLRITEKNSTEPPPSINFLGANQGLTISTDFDKLIEFAGQDVVKKLTQPISTIVQVPPSCLGRTSANDIDKVNNIMRDLAAVNI